jgi:hypothetical protein
MTMKTAFIILAVSILWLFAIPQSSSQSVATTQNAATTLPQPSHFETIFDGHSLAGWNATGDANWRITNEGENNTIHADSGNGMLVTVTSYADFNLKLEFWVDEPANSGVFIRCSDAGLVTPMNSYEVNIFDTRPDQTYRNGGIVGVAAPSKVISTTNQWNSYEIIAKGSRLVAILNGVVTVDVQDSKFSSGPIALQYGAGIVRFRNIEIGVLE